MKERRVQRDPGRNIKTVLDTKESAEAQTERGWEMGKQRERQTDR